MGLSKKESSARRRQAMSRYQEFLALAVEARERVRGEADRARARGEEASAPARKFDCDLDRAGPAP